MKTLLMAVLLLPTLLFANELKPIGGTLSSRVSTSTLGMHCSEKLESGICAKYLLISKYEEGEYDVMREINLVNIKKDSREVARGIRAELNEEYAGFTVIASGLALYYSYETDASPLSAAVLVSGGAVIDIVKAPIVAGAFIVHKLTDAFMSKRVRSHFKYMLNPEKVGKTRSIRERVLENIKYIY